MQISHIGIVVRDLRNAIGQWQDVFGFKFIKQVEVPPEGLRSAFLSADGGTDGFMVELVEVIDPSDSENLVVKRLAAGGEGVLHLCMVDEDVAEVANDLQKRNLRFAVRPSATGRGNDRLFVGGKTSNGVMVEIISDLERRQILE